MATCDGMKPKFTQRVHSIVACIPPGQVATYADIARWACSEGAISVVSRVMGDVEGWHRVVHTPDGKLTQQPDHERAERQRKLLEQDNVTVEKLKVHYRVKYLERYRWLPNEG